MTTGVQFFGSQVLFVGSNVAMDSACCCCYTPAGGCCCIPITLHATLANVSGCGCADGQVVTLTFDSANPLLFRWLGSATVCGHVVDFTLSYLASTGTPCLVNWSLILHYADACEADQSSSVLGTPCSPMSAVFAGITICGCAGTINATVTA